VPVLDKEPLHEVKAAEARPVELEPERSYAPIEIALASEPGQPKKPIPLQGPAESAAEMGTPEPLLPLDEPPAPDAGRAADAAVAKLAPAAAPPTDAAAVQPAVNAPNPAPAPAPAAPSPVSVPPERQAAMRLAQRMAARDPDGARLVMRAGAAEIPARTLSAQSWNELARAFVDDAGKAQGESRRELAQLAILCCRRGLEVAPDGALAPRNWLLAARVCDELLRDRPESDRLLGELAQRFPQTPEGAFALKRLKAMNPG